MARTLLPGHLTLTTSLVTCEAGVCSLGSRLTGGVWEVHFKRFQLLRPWQTAKTRTNPCLATFSRICTHSLLHFTPKTNDEGVQSVPLGIGECWQVSLGHPGTRLFLLQLLNHLTSTDLPIVYRRPLR